MVVKFMSKSHAKRWETRRANYGSSGLGKSKYQQDKLWEIRNDPKMTAIRYDEIIKLRMLLLDILEDLEEAGEDGMADRIKYHSKKWGNPGDCA